jgi:hypothetical protein
MLSQTLIRSGLFVTAWVSGRISVWLFLLVDIHTVGQLGIVIKRIQKELQSKEHALQRTRRERRGRNPCVSCAGSLSLGR